MGREFISKAALSAKATEGNATKPWTGLLALASCALIASFLPSNKPQELARISDEKRYESENQTVQSFILHYSTVRSALTSFLMTAGLATLAAYFRTEVGTDEERAYLASIGTLLLIAATVVCLIFSYRTERSNLYWTELWRWSKGQLRNYPVGFKNYKPGFARTFVKMYKDQINWLIVFGVFAILFSIFNIIGPRYLQDCVRPFTPYVSRGTP